jgi:Uma2 family endonuclease
MALVSLPTTNEILDAANHLPIGATLLVPGITWDDYECFLNEIGNRGDLRVSYDSGWLEIMSPSDLHDQPTRFLDRLLSEFARIRNVDVEMYGHTTWKRRVLAKGVEADCSYYVKNARHVIGKNHLDLESVPPPDLAIEIDPTNSSLRKLPIYAALRVPELWRYDGQTLRMYALAEGTYVEIQESRFLAGLTGSLLTEYLELSKVEGQTKALQKFSRRLSRKR